MRFVVLGLWLAACGKPECPAVEAAADAGCADVHDVAFDAGESEAKDCIPAHEPVPDAVEPLDCVDPTQELQDAYAQGWNDCWADAWFEGYAAEGTTGCSAYQ